MAQSQLTDQTFQAAQQAHSSGRLAEAQHGYQSVLQANSEHAEAWHLLGVLLGQSGEAQRAVEFINKSIDLQPRNPKALYNLGRILQDAGAATDAVLAYTRAVRLDKSYALAWNNLGTAFLNIDHYEGAHRAFESGILADPSYEPLHDNMCRMAKRQGDFALCLKSTDVGLKHLPDSPILWIHRADACFALGHLEDAWKAYDWRFRSSENVNIPPDYPLQEWQGEPLSNKTVLIWTEQGPGEVFLCSTMLDEIIAQAKKCIIVTTARLLPILARSFEGIEVLDGEHVNITPETADFQTSTMKLGRWLRKSWADFPTLPPHIKADPVRKEAMRQAIPPADDSKLVVGLSWRSFGVNTADHKSLTLDMLRPILSVPGVRFVSLQYGDVGAELKQFISTTGLKISCEPGIDPVTDLDGHLAQVAAMDLVISSSNTTVHAAAAQGIPTWCAVPYTLGEGLRWAWFVDRSDSPWYSSLKLYRQDIRGDWTSPIARIAVDLAVLRAESEARDQDDFDLGQHLLSVAAAYHNAGQPKASALVSAEAIRHGNDSVTAYRIVAQALGHLDRHDEAIEIFDQALKQHPDSTDLLNDRALARLAIGRVTEAEEDLEQVLSYDPESLEALNNMGRAKTLAGDGEQALNYLSKAALKAPDKTSIKLAVASRLNELGRPEEARPILEDLIQRNDQASEAAACLGIGLLFNGSLEDGWGYLRHRLARPSANIRYDHFPFPIWDGQSISGKRVLVWTEQGIGEELLIATLLRELAKKAKSVTLLCSSRMVPLLKRSLHGIRVASRDEPLPAEAVDPSIDVQMSLSDVGQLLRPSLNSFPKALKKPTLKADAKAVRAFKKQYQNSERSLLIGLSWHSAAPDFGFAKSLAPDALNELMKNVPARFASLQYDADPNHISTLAAAAPERWIHDQSVDPLKDMDRAAAQVAAMDFVVTVSNTTAHTAGALGIPTALLAPRHTGRHWYWFEGQKSCAWYPSVEIYDCEAPLNWSSALESIATRLTKLAEKS